MPPKIHLVRHGQGFHNVTRNYTLRDAVLTPKGKEQCSVLSAAFPYHNRVDAVFASPLRRTIQTASLSFGPTLARKEVPFVLLPVLQEVGDNGSDTGIASTGDELKEMLPELFKEDKLEFDLEKIDASAVTEGWNVKKGYFAYEKDAILKRAADFRNWLFQRPESEVVLVSHGAIAHFLTEDWDVEDPMITTAWYNCEHREFAFTTSSTAEDAHVKETAESRKKRGKEPESDPHVLDQLEKVQEEAKNQNECA